MIINAPTVQSPKAYDLLNLQGAQLATRMAATASATQRGNLRTAIQDGAYLYKIHAAETAAGLVDANLTFGYLVGDVRRYGAVGDGVADDTAALNNGFKILGFEAFLPPGTFRITANLAIPTCSRIRGSGWTKTIIAADPGVTKVLSLTGGTATPHVEHFRVSGNATANAVGIVVGDGVLTSNFRIDNVWITGFSAATGIGLYLRDIVTLAVHNIFVELCGANIVCLQSSQAGCPTTVNFWGGATRTSSSVGASVQSGQAIAFHGTVFESNSHEGAIIGGAAGVPVKDVLFDGKCWFEGNWHLSPAQFHLVVDATTSGTSTNVTVSSAFFNGAAGDAQSMHAAGTFANLNVGTDVLVPNIGSTVVTYNGGAYGDVDLHPSLVANYATIVSDPSNRVTNRKDPYNPWTAWVPVYSSSVGNAAATFTGGAVTTTVARYKKVGTIAHVEINFNATLLAVTPTYLDVTLPALITPLAGDVIFAPAVTQNGANAEIGMVQARASSTSLRFTRIPNANYGSGAAVQGLVSFCFECQ